MARSQSSFTSTTTSSSSGSSSSVPSKAYVRGNKQNDANSTALVLAKSKTQEFDDAMTSTGMCHPVKKIIWDYSFDTQLLMLRSSY